MSFAAKVRISDIYEGRFEEVTVNGVRLFRLKTGVSTSLVRIMGVVVHSYINPDGTYAFLTIDDTTGVIDVKAWYDGVNLLLTPAGEIYQAGNILDVIGRVKSRDENLYINPTLVIKVDNPNWLTVRRLEILRLRLKHLSAIALPERYKQKLDQLKSRILDEIIYKSPAGASVEDLEENLDIPAGILKRLLEELAEEGLLYVDGEGKYRATAVDAYEPGDIP